MARGDAGRGGRRRIVARVDQGEFAEKGWRGKLEEEHAKEEGEGGTGEKDTEKCETGGNEKKNSKVVNAEG